MPTTWRLLERIDAAHQGRVRSARAAARERAWDTGAAPKPGSELRLDFDATITIAHSEKEDAAPTWKRSFGFPPLLCFLDRPGVAGGEALVGILRAGNAGSNTAEDHVTVLDLALAQLPEAYRPTPGQDPAIQTDEDLREGAWVFEATGMVALRGWPEGSRLILRKERPHPGAQLTFTDLVRGGVTEPVGRDRRLPARLAREHRRPGSGIGQGPAPQRERCASRGDGIVQGGTSEQ